MQSKFWRHTHGCFCSECSHGLSSSQLMRIICCEFVTSTIAGRTWTRHPQMFDWLYSTISKSLQTWTISQQIIPLGLIRLFIQLHLRNGAMKMIHCCHHQVSNQELLIVILLCLGSTFGLIFWSACVMCNVVLYMTPWLSVQKWKVLKHFLSASLCPTMLAPFSSALFRFRHVELHKLQKFVLLLILVYWLVIDDLSKIGQEFQARSDLICIFKLGGN